MARQLTFDDLRTPAELLSADEIFSRATPEILARIKENRRIERKPAGLAPRALGDYLAMWANSPPEGGIVVVGMGDNGEVEGITHVGSNRINELEKAGAIYAPQALVESIRIPATKPSGEADELIVFRVRYDEKRVVENVQGGVFVRVGDSKFELNQDQIRELKISKGQIELEQEPCGLKYPDDFNIDKISNYTSSYRTLHEISPSVRDEDILIQRHLAKRDQSTKGLIPNLACGLLFARDPGAVVPGARIRFIRYEGDFEQYGEMLNVVKDVVIDGVVGDLIVAAANLLAVQIRDFTRLGRDGRFFTAPEYPRDAWYELLVNACVHRSYGLKNAPVFVKMFNDRLVVESPGGFPGHVNASNIYETHYPRNPWLMDAMRYLNFVRMANEGTNRIRQLMRESNLPDPEFKQESVGSATVRATIRNNVAHRKVYVDADAAKVLGEAVFDSLNEMEKLIINYLAEHETMTVSDATRITGRGWKVCKKWLDGLETKKIVEYSSNYSRDPKAHYKLLRAKNGDSKKA